MTITIRMVAPPERVQTASAKAIQQYEKRREFTLARVSAGPELTTVFV